MHLNSKLSSSWSRYTSLSLLKDVEPFVLKSAYEPNLFKVPFGQPEQSNFNRPFAMTTYYLRSSDIPPTHDIYQYLQ